MDGNLEAARHAYLEAVQISQAAGSIYMVMIANSNLADVLLEQGELHQAARIYTENLEIATRPDGQKLPLADRCYAGLGNISYEWNHLEAAARYVQQCIGLCQQWGNFNLLATGYVRLARLEQAERNLEKAQEAMRAAEQLVSEQRLTPRVSAWVRYAAARWWISQGSLERATHFVQQMGLAVESPTDEAEIPYARESEYLLLLRLLLAQGDHEAALSLSGRLLRAAEATGRTGRIIEILILKALACQGKKDMSQALAALERAVSLAQPEGYARVFLDEGEPLAKLLYQAKTHLTGGSYAAELLSEASREHAAELPPDQLLIEPLTGRELEVLELIAAGHSNQAIAGRLVISLPTVKRHISNIYAKLGVQSRTQAVSLGRELGLLK
jgi:LuxR family maltose regulon positive regulatory protein